MFRVYLVTYLPAVGTGDACYYIGSTGRNIEHTYYGSVKSKRWAAWWRSETESRPELFDVRTLHSFDTEREAREKEFALLESVSAKTNPEYFNMSHNVGVFSDDARSSISKKAKGRHRSSDSIALHSKKMKGRKIHKNTAAKLRETFGHRKGKKMPDGFAESRSEEYSGAGNPFYGMSHSEETKKKISLANSGKKKTQREKDAISKFVSSTIWITNGVRSKRINMADEIPYGWRRGRANARQLQ